MNTKLDAMTIGTKGRIVALVLVVLLVVLLIVEADVLPAEPCLHIDI
jgi:hypothetical protein